MTKNEAIKAVGQAKVDELDNENVEHSSRVTDGTPYHGYTEFTATVDLDDGEFLIVRVYIDTETVNAADALDSLDWDTAFEDAEYEIN